MSEGGARGPAVPVPPKPQAVPARGGMTPSPPRAAPPLLPATSPAAPPVGHLVGVRGDAVRNPFLATPAPPPNVPPAMPSQAATPKAPPVQAPPPPLPAIRPPDLAEAAPSMIPVAFASEAPRELPVVAAARRADEMRAEVRAALSDVLDEALAPLHASLRELERRLDDVERRPLPSVAPTTRSDAQSAAVRARHDPFASVPAPAMRAPRPSMPVSYAQPSQTHGSVGPQAPAASLDFDVPFDGAKRRRKLATTFAVMLVLIFGALFAALAFSYNRGG